MRVTVLHNPNAGSEELDRTRLLGLLEDAGLVPEYHSTRRNGWKRAVERPTDLVVAAGGDGTVAKVARRLAGRGIPLAVLPLGTANNIASSLGISSNPEETVAGWATATLHLFDVAIATGPWGERVIIEAAGVGILPRLFVESVTRVPKQTVPASQQIPRNVELMLELLDQCRPSHLEIDVDGSDLSGPHVMVEAMNIRSIGPRLDLAPDAHPGDGLLDIVVVPDSDRDLLAAFLRHRLNGRSTDVMLKRVQGKRLRVRGAYPPLHLDDKVWPFGKETGRVVATMQIDVQVIAGALQVLRGAPSDARKRAGAVHAGAEP